VKRLVFVGSGRFGVPALTMLAGPAAGDAGIELAGVVTGPARPRGRHSRPAATPIGDLAAHLELEPILAPARLRADESVAAIGALEPDLLVVTDYGQVVPGVLLDVPNGALNLHPSRLPRHRGASPIPATIIAGDRDTAVTIIRMDEGIDSGPIVAVSSPIAVEPNVTAPELEDLLAAEAAVLLEQTLPRWLAGEIEPLPQPTEGVTLTRLLGRPDGRLDPAQPAFLLERQVRALRPWPGTFLERARADRLAVLAAAVGPTEPSDREGRLVADGDGLALATSDGRLRLLAVQPPGGRAMSSAAYLRGRAGVLGTAVQGTGGTMAGR
jgi:methionyl-tRNA formyltransferase